MAQTESRPVASPDFSYLDSASLRDTFAFGRKRNELTFYVRDIRCANCVHKLESLPLSVPGLNRVRVDLPKKLANVEIDPARTSFATVADAFQKLGFEPLPLADNSHGHNLRKQEDRRELIRLAVAGFAAGNIMSFALAGYFGAAGEWKALFGWISFVLYLPVVTYVARPFYQGALQALKQKRLSIDLPMAVASFAGFVISTVELLRGGDGLYFDSLSGFLFLILVSRWTQRRLQRQYLEPSSWLESLQLLRARVVGESGWQWQAQSTLRKDDHILLLEGETVPAEVELTDSVAYFSLAWLTGEGDAKTFLKGGRIPAGARLLSTEAHLKVQKTLNQTPFGEILRKTREFTIGRVPMVQVSDRWSQWLLATVFTIAGLFLLFYWTVSPVDAVQRALALIIIACPCAMAFGTPLAVAAAMRRAQNSGVIVQDGGVFEHARQISTIFFDKTGTLTDTEMTLEEPANSISENERQILLTLENQSAHPLAFAFRRALAPIDPLPMTDFNEIPGQGVEGLIAGQRFELKKVNDGGRNASALYCNGRELRRFHFTSRPRPDSAETLNRLRDRGLNIRLLSGDTQESALHLGRQLGFKDSEIFGHLSPEQKAEHIAATSKAMMVGDGVNDALALMKADVSVAVSGGVEAAMRSSQVFLTEPSVCGITRLLDASEGAYRLIRRNLALSLLYNGVAGTMALLGMVNPMVAAVLMPISSGMILFNTWLGSRE